MPRRPNSRPKRPARRVNKPRAKPEIFTLPETVRDYELFNALGKCPLAKSELTVLNMYRKDFEVEYQYQKPGDPPIRLPANLRSELVRILNRYEAGRAWLAAKLVELSVARAEEALRKR
ncbi:MAG TPA: hypothetical protein VJG83_05560 [archaeon]|nr:hypothetical protein [archaeon]